MDPQATLDQISDHLDAGFYSDALELINIYYQWRLNGGFAPAGGDERVAELVRRLQRCIEVLS